MMRVPFPSLPTLFISRKCIHVYTRAATRKKYRCYTLLDYINSNDARVHVTFRIDHRAYSIMYMYNTCRRKAEPLESYV